MGIGTLDSPRTAIGDDGTEFYELTAPASATTPRLARQFVTGTLEATGHPTLIDDARVCVSDRRDQHRAARARAVVVRRDGRAAGAGGHRRV
ncbi:hypothetical protein ABZ442_11640 [Streptomyces triculaminicus]|uniref:hypothetical protein n=1 Tax=Streptomyces triculaminicus TaxID=2816232 RepID=UPI003404EF3F